MPISLPGSLTRGKMFRKNGWDGLPALGRTTIARRMAVWDAPQIIIPEYIPACQKLSWWLIASLPTSLLFLSAIWWFPCSSSGKASFLPWPETPLLGHFRGSPLLLSFSLLHECDLPRCCSRQPSLHMFQGLCTCHLLCLEHSSPTAWLTLTPILPPCLCSLSLLREGFPGHRCKLVPLLITLSPCCLSSYHLSPPDVYLLYFSFPSSHLPHSGMEIPLGKGVDFFSLLCF